jgi:hypothetical protein
VQLVSSKCAKKVNHGIRLGGTNNRYTRDMMMMMMMMMWAEFNPFKPSGHYMYHPL